MGQGSGGRNDCAHPLPLGIIKVIHAISKGVNLNTQKGILGVASVSEADSGDQAEKKPRRMLVPITFDEANLERTS